VGVPNDRSLGFYIYYNGRLATFSTISAGTTNSATTHNPGPDPPWFSW
jgi:hypothetical protein